MGLSRLVIGILSDNHHLYLVKRTEVEGIEYQFAWRIAGCGLILPSHSVSKLRKVRFLKLATKMSFPRILYLYCHNSFIIRHGLHRLTRINLLFNKIREIRVIRA